MVDNRPPDDRAENEEHNGSEQIRWLRSLGDRDALFHLMESERNTELGLEAAEALVELGDVRGLDHLIAALRSTNPSLRSEAERLLIEIDHPRGLRALRDLGDRRGAGPARSAPLNLQAPRDQLRRDLEAQATDELVALWHERHHSELPDSVVHVLEKILRDRLGSLPREEADAGDEIDQDVDPRVQALWIEGDTDALMRIFEDAADVRLQLEAAEALAHLGDEDALDVLIEALDDSDVQVSETAAGMLDWLDLPKGNQALDERGIEFETDARDLFREGETEPAMLAPPTPPERSVPWVSKTEALPTGGYQQHVPSAPLSAQTASQQPAPSSTSGILLVGAVGGLIGFIFFRFGLDILDFQPLPVEMGDWIQPRALLYIGVSILAGAVSGAMGSRMAQGIGRRFGWEPAEGDLLPLFGALFEGASSGLILSWLIYSITGF